MLIQDGSSFAVRDGAYRTYPGRFTTVSPAAVELHVTWDLCRERIEQVVLTPDTFTERAELPPAESLRGDLLLAERGYFERAYLRSIDRHGGHFSDAYTASRNAACRRRLTCGAVSRRARRGRYRAALWPAAAVWAPPRR